MTQDVILRAGQAQATDIGLYNLPLTAIPMGQVIGTVVSSTIAVPTGCTEQLASLVIDPLAWGLPGTQVTIRTYAWIGGVRIFTGGGVTSSGGGTLPNIAGPAQAGPIEIEIEQTGGIPIGATMEF